MDSADSIRQYQADGCVRIRGFFGAATLAAVRRELSRYMSEVVPALSQDDRTLEADGNTVRNLWRMERHDPYFDSLARDPRHLPLVAKVVQGEPILMAVETFNKPARVGSGVPPHQDNAYFCQAPPDMATIWIAIDAATEANGPVDYLKGSHRYGTLPHQPTGVAGNSMGLVQVPPYDDGDILRGTLEPGDALIHNCQTIHWSPPNRTDSPRCGLLMVFRGVHTAPDPKLKAAYDAARANPAPSRT